MPIVREKSLLLLKITDMRTLFPLLGLLLLSCAVFAEKPPKPDTGAERLMLAGDRPDPSILRDGDTYYMVHSSFEYTPGLLVYRSKDLIRWEPLTCALQRYVGSVYAPDIVKHKDKWYIYFPAVVPGRTTNMVVSADSPEGPWSEPVDLHIGGIDPGHAVDAEGNRYLMMSDGYLAPLAADGLSVTGPAQKVYDGWEFPKEWDVEGFCLEGPKITKIGKYFYMLSAEGGTAGPPTSHMVVVARAERLTGPWENSPYNPLVHTYAPDERWCSKGHGTLVDTPDGQWYVVYHAYERGFYTLGRQTLIEPVEMTKDGWPVAVSVPAKKQPAKQASFAGSASFSDNFSTDRTGTQWQFAGAYDPQRVRYENRSLVMQARGGDPSDACPMLLITGDHAYEMEVEAECPPEAAAGLVLFYSPKLYTGIGLDSGRLAIHLLGKTESSAVRLPQRVWFRLRNDRHIVSFWYSSDGRNWTKTDKSCETSGYHHNMAGEFLSLRPGIYAAGRGEVVFRNFRYKTL